MLIQSDQKQIRERREVIDRVTSNDKTAKRRKLQKAAGLRKKKTILTSNVRE